jgi:divalent metal cation (Fe/Co/Zn/Cd) transporter
MDRALGDDDQHRIRQALRPFELEGVRFHALRTRQAGRRAFVSVHVLVPRAWTVQRGHDEVERVEEALRDQLPYPCLCR